MSVLHIDSSLIQYVMLMFEILVTRRQPKFHQSCFRSQQKVASRLPTWAVTASRPFLPSQCLLIAILVIIINNNIMCQLSWLRMWSLSARHLHCTLWRTQQYPYTDHHTSVTSLFQ